MSRGPKPAKSKEAKPPVVRKLPKGDGATVRDLEKRLAEAHDQQAATAEILKVISSSPNDVQPVFDAVAESAGRLCESFDSSIWRRDGDWFKIVAHHGPILQDISLPVIRGTAAGRAVLDGRTIHVNDMQNEDAEFPESCALARRLGFRTLLCVPLIREGVAMGVIALRRTEVRLFTDRQVALLKTFADQAVIAIENVRLVKELEARNRNLTEALDQQTATSEILRVISSSPTDLRPVMNAVAQSAARLCEAIDAHVYQKEGDLLRVVASHGALPLARQEVPVSRQSVIGRAVIDRWPIHVGDLAVALDEFPDARRMKEMGYRTVLATPLLREGEPIGAIVIRRTEVRPFSSGQMALLATFADQAVIAIENVRLFTELQARNRDLTEALERQTATSDILQIISSSPTDIQPVFDAIIRSAVTLCEATFGGLHLLDGEQLTLTAHNEVPESELEVLRTVFPFPPRSNSLVGRAVLDRSPVQIEDLRSIPGYHSPAIQSLARYRTGLAVPMLREGVPIGGLALWRSEVRPFTDRQIELIVTFASQAVIAIENVRLFKELQQKNDALTQAHAQVSEALDQQTATAEILRVISRSPTDVQPVFEAIGKSAVRLMGAILAAVYEFDGALVHLRVLTPATWPHAEALRQRYPSPPDLALAAGRVILSRAVLHIADLQTDSATPLLTRQIAETMGLRGLLWVPMLQEGAPVGVIGVVRGEVGFFADKQVNLLQTFADQAVIAIQNVRLFTELQEKNQALTQAHAEVTETLDQQTATSEILRVKAQDLCRAKTGTVFTFDGERIHVGAAHSLSAEAVQSLRQTIPMAPSRGGATPRAILSRAIVYIPDIREDPEYGHHALAKAVGYLSALAVPMMHEGKPIGAITVTGAEAGAFSQTQIELLKTFADQAVIAIENVRLFKELQARTQELTRSVDQLTALGEVGRAVSSTLDLETVLTTIVARAVQLSGLDGGVVFEYDAAAEEFEQRASTAQEALVEARRRARIRKGDGVVGRTAITHEPVQVPDITLEGAYAGPLRESLLESGVRALLAVPMLREGQLIGSLVVARNAPGGFPRETVDLLSTFATQSALAIQNARLFREIADKSRQLEIASQLKSEFLANMSHELRTPLNAIIGFSEVLSEKMFGELNEKQEEYSKDIHASGEHLLSLINDILDLSKIEAGRMELELTDFDLPTAIENALMLVRERAGRRSIAVHTNIDNRLGQIQGDERKVRQVVLNLLSNAIKFTPEGGRIDVGAAPKDGLVEISVSDTGVGIAPEDQEKVFEEFRQVGTAAKKVEGTGLGLTLCRKFVELHGGKIWVKSELGAGSTFNFTIPMRRAD